MERYSLGAFGASAFLVLIGVIVVYLAALTIWAHAAGMRVLPQPGESRTEEQKAAAKRWVRRVALLYGAGWAAFTWGALLLGVLEEGLGFFGPRLALAVMWAISPLLVFGLAHLYWSVWARVGVPDSV